MLIKSMSKSRTSEPQIATCWVLSCIYVIYWPSTVQSVLAKEEKAWCSPYTADDLSNRKLAQDIIFDSQAYEEGCCRWTIQLFAHHRISFSVCIEQHICLPSATHENVLIFFLPSTGCVELVLNIHKRFILRELATVSSLLTNLHSRLNCVCRQQAETKKSYIRHMVCLTCKQAKQEGVVSKHPWFSFRID